MTGPDGEWPWDDDRFEEAMDLVEYNLEMGNTPPWEFLKQFKRCIEENDFEFAKAISESLPPNYDVVDTHKHIDWRKGNVEYQGTFGVKR